jgi:hypothetical protein
MSSSCVSKLVASRTFLGGLDRRGEREPHIRVADEIAAATPEIDIDG